MKQIDEPSALFASPSGVSATASWIADSAFYGADSLGVRPLPMAMDSTLCTELEAPADHLAHYTLGRAGHVAGMPAEPRPMLPGYDTSVMAMVLGALLLLAMCSRHIATTATEMWTDLTRVRTRSVFAGAHTRSGRVMGALLTVLFVSEGALLWACSPVLGLTMPAIHTSLVLAMLISLALTYYCWQWVAYTAAGRLFTVLAMADQWVRGFEASQMLMAPAMVAIALGAMYRPEWAVWFAGCAATVYVAGRMLFIYKGFRIFYTDFTSLIYFILYLCTLEIVPLLLIWRAARVNLC